MADNGGGDRLGLCAQKRGKLHGDAAREIPKGFFFGDL
jgi:hypothetical protein